MKHGYVIGMELNENICQISYYDDEKQEPHTVEVNADNYQIPLMIGKKGDQWVFGKEAQRLEVLGKGSCASDILSRAIKRELVKIGEQTYEGIWLLSMYIQLVLKRFERIDAITFSIPQLDIDVVQLLKSVGQKLGVAKEHIYVQDYKESFGYYMCNQPKELWQYESALFYCQQDEIKAFMMRKLRTGVGNGREFFVTVEEVASGELQGDDEKFKEFVQGVFEKKLISSVFLTGDGFEDNWYPDSLKVLCNGRRVFLGNNLFSRGACYTAYSKLIKQEESLVYLDDTKLTEQICLKLRVKGADVWYPVVAWGTHWYEGDRQFELLLEDTKETEIQVESLVKRGVEVIPVSFEGLPRRKNYTLRLQVNIIFMDDHTCKITWKDIGFGAFFAPSGFQTETVIDLGGSNGQFNSLS